MKVYKLITDPDLETQTDVDAAPDYLLKKGLYSRYPEEYLDCIGLLPKVEKTDILSTGTLSLKGLIVNTSIYHQIKDFALHEIQFVDIRTEPLKEYKFMFFNGDLTHQLDYQRSEFRLLRSSPIRTKILDREIPPNRNDLIEIYRNECVQSIFKQLVPLHGYRFLQNFQIDKFDVFRIGHFDKSFYISERVKNRLEGFTGFECVEAPYFEEDYECKVSE
ncbi:MAG: hypothetical protein AAFQ68_05065 [Bacteroidota bacterium]